MATTTVPTPSSKRDVHFVLPQFAGLGPTLRRLRTGDAWWLALGVALEAVSIAGEIGLLRGVFSQRGSKLGWRFGIFAGTAPLGKAACSQRVGRQA